MNSDAQLRVLLVDAHGALGHALVSALGRLGCAITWFGRYPAPSGQALMTVVPGDRGRPEDLRQLGSGTFDAAVDAGARDRDDPGYLAAALRGRVGLVIHLSSWRVYAGADDAGPAAGPAPSLPLSEDAPKTDGPRLDAEDGLWQVRAPGVYPATVLRMGALYGPGIGLAREWHVLDRLRRGRRRMALPDGGGQILHRLYVDNAVHALITALDHPREADGCAFNVGDSDVPTAARLCQDIAAVVGATMDGVPVPRSWYDPRNPWAAPYPVVLDRYRLRSRIGYQEPVPPAIGLERTVRWLWDLPDDEILGTLAPYWRRFGDGHDYFAEDRALARWEGRA